MFGAELIMFALAADPSPADIEFFEKKVRPVLVAACFECHGGGKKLRGGLDLTTRAGLLKGGDTGPALVPGDPPRSRFATAISYKDDLKMPPRGKLSDEQIADLTRWVKIGAPWPGGKDTVTKANGEFDLQARKKAHWAWQPLARTTPPAVKDAAWPRNDIDRFVLARLESAGLHPAPAADKRTLLRRVTFDLTGLPPTLDEIRAFLADDSSDAYEGVVDRLLKSPAYGERWARHWLDLVRYAETRGHEFDFDIADSWRYRDYVIRAFNADVPYDQIVREHVAGDLLPNPRRHPTDGTNESILGAGFWFLGEGKHSPVDIRLDGDDRRDNMLDVFGKTFLGLTIACARCHDHKFDAISTADYYALAGYLQSFRQQRAFLDSPDRVGKPLEALRNLQAEAVARATPRAAERLDARAEKLPAALLDARTRFDPKKGGELLELWKALADPTLPASTEAFAERRRAVVEQRKARAARAAAGPFVAVTALANAGYRDCPVTGDAFGSAPTRSGDVMLRPDGEVRELLPPGLAHSGVASRRLQGALRTQTFALGKRRLWLRAAGQNVQVRLVIDGYQIIRAPLHGHFEFTLNSPDKLAWHAIDLAMAAGMSAYLEILDDGDGWVAFDRAVLSDDGPPDEAPNRVLTGLLDDATVTSATALAGKLRAILRECVSQWRDGKLAGLSDAAERVALLNELLRLDTLDDAKAPADPELARGMSKVRDAEAALPSPQRGMAAADGTGINEYVHIRGSHKNRGPEVPRRFLEAVAGRDQPAPKHGSGRLDLAERMLAPSNPLLARVMVNRLWHHHFGRGIVASTDDFGIQGQRPTHPELLDWLSARFVRDGWSLKSMHRLMLTSAAYRQAASGEAKAEEADPQNLLLHRANVRRLEGEAIRDSLLALSGRLDRTMGGPGVLPHLTPFLLGRGRPASGPLDGAGRRSIYLAVRRNFLNPFFLAFDTPIPFTTIGRRSVSNVPAQALALLNNPLVVQQSRLWAERVLAEKGLSPAQRVEHLYEMAFARQPTAAELAEAIAFLGEQEKELGSADDVRAWADFAHVLVNVKEFIFVR